MSETARAIRGLFPEAVVTLTAMEGEQGPLLPEEEASIARAVAKRRREFTAGRSAARRALAQLGIQGIQGFPLLPDSDRVPRWPDGVVGSISHCAGCCAVAVARRGSILSLGLDVERAEPLEDELLRRICTPHELARARAEPPPGGADWGKLVFSAKESAYKCYFPLARKLLGFQEMEIDFSPDAARFTARLVSQRAPDAAGARRFEGRAAWTRELVFAGVVLEAQPR